jgi:hypothetical protein
MFEYKPVSFPLPTTFFGGSVNKAEIEAELKNSVQMGGS